MSVIFHDLTLKDYKILVKNKDQDVPAEQKISTSDLYFVHTSTPSPDKDRNSVPYLLFKGYDLVGNSGVILQKSVDGFLTLTSSTGTEIKVNIFDPVALSSNIIGTKGQSLYIINEFDALDVNGKTKTSHATYLYYWDENVNVTDNTSITEVTGSWVNANINFTSSIMIGDVQFDAVKLGKLLDLLV